MDRFIQVRRLPYNKALVVTPVSTGARQLDVLQKDMSSIFTQIIRREIPSEIVWEDDEFIAILDVNPVSRGHVLLIPKEETDSIFDLSEGCYQRLWKVVRFLERPIRIAVACPRIGIAVEGFGVAHVHVHLVPVYQGGDLDPNRAERATRDELAEVGDFLRVAIGREQNKSEHSTPRG